MRFNAKLLVPAAVLLAVSACSSEDPGFGEALRYVMAAQTIDPDPVYAEDDAKPGDNGEKGATAVKKYRQGQTKSLRIESASSGGGSGGGGGSGPQ